MTNQLVCVYCQDAPADPGYDRCLACRTYRDDESHSVQSLINSTTVRNVMRDIISEFGPSTTYPVVAGNAGVEDTACVYYAHVAFSNERKPLCLIGQVLYRLDLLGEVPADLNGDPMNNLILFEERFTYAARIFLNAAQDTQDCGLTWDRAYQSGMREIDHLESEDAPDGVPYPA